MATPSYPRIVYLSNIFDSHYHELRGEKFAHTLLTASFRACVLRCLQMASGREIIVLSTPPKATERRAGKWLPAVETKFDTHRQFVCANWDIPKLRIPLAWLLYARHVLRHVRSGDVVVIDNYEFLYIVAARLVRILRRVKFVLVYLDGKHLIERSWGKILSTLAEAGGRGLLSGALLSTPTLGERLPAALPKELVPGFVPDERPPAPAAPNDSVRFLYSGWLDEARGVDLLLAAMEHLPAAGWRLHITGDGPLADPISRCAAEPRWQGKMEFHRAMPSEAYERLKATCHVGLNCQRVSDPISGVTLPSKVFTYLSAGLMVISSKAGALAQLCPGACFYYDGDRPESLAGAMREVIANYSAVRRKIDPAVVFDRYSQQGTVKRLRPFWQAVEGAEGHQPNRALSVSAHGANQH